MKVITMTPILKSIQFNWKSNGSVYRSNSKSNQSIDLLLMHIVHEIISNFYDALYSSWIYHCLSEYNSFDEINE